MKMALSELTIDGIDINRDLLAEILSDEQFVSGEYTTDLWQSLKRNTPTGRSKRYGFVCFQKTEE
mgnify:CR=1 FL=1